MYQGDTKRAYFLGFTLWGRKENKGKWWKAVENWLGQVQIKVDDKGRFSLPASAVDGFPTDELVLSVGVFEKKPFLELLTLEEWDEKISTLENFSERDPKLKAYKRFLLSGSSKINIDKQNRVTIPGFQRDLIKIVKEAVIVNLENKIELWSADLWAEVSNNFINDFENLEDWANGFEELGENKQTTELGRDHELKSVA